MDAEERRDLATRMAHRTIEAAVATPGIDEVLVVTPDQAVRDLARRMQAQGNLQVTGLVGFRSLILKDSVVVSETVRDDSGSLFFLNAPIPATGRSCGPGGRRFESGRSP